jgi:hypothetical protein
MQAQRVEEKEGSPAGAFCSWTTPLDNHHFGHQHACG